MKFEYISISKDVRSGVPCIRETRFPVAQLLVELVECQDANDPNILLEITNEYDLDYDDCVGALKEIAQYFNRPFNEGGNS